MSETHNTLTDQVPSTDDQHSLTQTEKTAEWLVVSQLALTQLPYKLWKPYAISRVRDAEESTLDEMQWQIKARQMSEEGESGHVPTKDRAWVELLTELTDGIGNQPEMVKSSVWPAHWKKTLRLHGGINTTNSMAPNSQTKLYHIAHFHQPSSKVQFDEVVNEVAARYVAVMPEVEDDGRGE